jgi:hypothetical protein
MATDPKRVLSELDQCASAGKVSRREALIQLINAGVITGVTGTHLLRATAADADAAQVRLSGIRVVEGTQVVTEKSVITASDISFLGFYQFPYLPSAPTALGSVVAKGNAPMSITRRTDNGNFLVLGGGQGGQATPALARLYEVALPAQEPSLTLASAPSMTHVRRYGEVMGDHDNPSDSYTALAIYWDETQGGVYLDFQTSYQVANSPCLMFTELGAVTDAYTTYGPFRTNIGSKVFCGSMFHVPQTWADAYLDGHRIVTSSKAFGGAGHSHGLAIMQSDLDDFLPRTATANTGGFSTTIGTDYAVTASLKIYHDLNHRMLTTATYKECGPIAGPPDYPSYSCALGATLVAGEPYFGSTQAANGTSDSVTAACFVDLDDKWGVFNFTQLVDTPTGYTAPGDADGQTHRGYAALGGSGGIVDANGERCCCHSQPDYNNSGSPGPWAHCREQFIDIYDPDRLAAIMAPGSALPIYHLQDGYPDTRIKLRDLLPAYSYVGDGTNVANTGSGGDSFGMSCVVDADARRIYVCLRRHLRTVSALDGNAYRGVMLVFAIA